MSRAWGLPLPNPSPCAERGSGRFALRLGKSSMLLDVSEPMQRGEDGMWPIYGTLARGKRADATFAEERLWLHLRAGRLAGLKFRRQHLVGTYIVDFYCVQAKLIVEVDGSSHEGQEEHDALREGELG